MSRLLARLRRPRRLGPILACTFALPAAAALPAARDLPAEAHAAAEGGFPLVLMFSRAECGWCAQVRRLHLEPIAARLEGAVPVRQVDIDRNRPLVDFAGRATNHRAYARSIGVKLVPTVVFLGPDGRPVAEPIVGAVGADFYGAYLERGLEEGRRRVSGEPR